MSVAWRESMAEFQKGTFRGCELLTFDVGDSQQTSAFLTIGRVDEQHLVPFHFHPVGNS